MTKDSKKVSTDDGENDGKTVDTNLFARSSFSDFIQLNSDSIPI